jgi:hypothetical protein
VIDFSSTGSSLDRAVESEHFRPRSSQRRHCWSHESLAVSPDTDAGPESSPTSSLSSSRGIAPGAATMQERVDLGGQRRVLTIAGAPQASIRTTPIATDAIVRRPPTVATVWSPKASHDPGLWAEESDRAAVGRVRVHRGVLEPQTSPLDAGRALPGQLGRTICPIVGNNSRTTTIS